MIKNIKIILLISLIAILMNCSNDQTYDTYKIFGDKDNEGFNSIWYTSGEYIVFDYDGTLSDYCAIAKIDPDGKNLEIIYEPDFRLTDISDDGYILGSSETSYNKFYIYYYKPYENPVITSIEGKYPTIYGNLSGKYNISYLYDDNPDTDGWSIYLCDINGSPPKKLIGEGDYYNPNFSSDGSKIVYYKLSESSVTELRYAYLCVYDLNKGKEEIIRTTKNNCSVQSPKFSPDDKYIAFAESDWDKYQDPHEVVWLIGADGSDPHSITRYPYDPGLETMGTTYLSWSPDGKWIVYDLQGFYGFELWKMRVFE